MLFTLNWRGNVIVHQRYRSPCKRNKIMEYIKPSRASISGSNFCAPHHPQEGLSACVWTHQALNSNEISFSSTFNLFSPSSLGSIFFKAMKKWLSCIELVRKNNGLSNKPQSKCNIHFRLVLFLLSLNWNVWLLILQNRNLDFNSVLSAWTLNSIQTKPSQANAFMPEVWNFISFYWRDKMMNS